MWKKYKLVLILKKKNIDLHMLILANTVELYNDMRKHKLINKKLTEDEFEILKEFISE